eukprot:TRINITY_DN1179_c0_g1_i1.p1 TRINITY_DN1179_c0_g1~~TRINITY_DN1179_c0_g1_i1.p1  ORF type:complete len:817 (-),score=131.69 TRINITY_DN1179_c0_g1_i1:16-2466(-)
MAEARQAVSPVPALGLHTYRVDTSYHSLQAAVTGDGLVLYVPHPAFIWKNIRRWFYRMRNSLRALMWPAKPVHVVAFNIGVVYYVLRQPSNSWFRSGPLANFLWAFDSYMPWTSKLTTPVRVTYLAFNVGAVACTALLQLNRLFLRALLHYQSWMYESKPSLKTKIWGLLIKALYVRRGEHHLYDFQDSLPRLPVPVLRDTCTRYLRSMEPLLTPEEFAETKTAADLFCKKEGPKLQRYLRLKSWVADNYVTDWWLNLVYLRGRSSLLINSNFYGIGLVRKEFLPTTNQVARAAWLTHRFCKLKQLLDKEQVAPQLLQGVRPICMAQYQNVFSMTRIPGKEMDSLRQWEPSESRHIIVLYKGNYYRINMYGTDLKLISAFRLQAILEGIVCDSNPRTEDDLLSQISVLTTTDRTTWASVREQHFSEGLNRASLNVVERAMFILHLDERSPENLTDEGRLLFHGGDGTSRWCDKSFMLIVFANGFSGIHVEHSWADAPVIAHLYELSLANEQTEKDVYDPETGCIRASSREEAMGVMVHNPSSMSNLYGLLPKGQGKVKVRAAERLNWTLTDRLADAILDAKAYATKAIADLNLVVRCHEAFGKGEIKKFGVAPDACIQMALQLAYYRDQGQFVQTYESAMTRLYRSGRTETIRSASNQSAAFVKAMEDPSVPKEQKIKLLREAGKQHVLASREAMCGRGVDRHLFALYVVAMGMGVESPFLRKVMSVPWRLSTSQVPQRQTPKGTWPGDDEGDLVYSASGGFGPVADDGYGVSYAVSGNKRLFFHVSSKNSAGNTDSARFQEHIFGALADIRALFV